MKTYFQTSISSAELYNVLQKEKMPKIRFFFVSSSSFQVIEFCLHQDLLNTEEELPIIIHNDDVRVFSLEKYEQSSMPFI